MEQLGFVASNPLEAPCLLFTVSIRCEYLSEIAGNGEGNVCVGYTRLGHSSADAVFELYDNASGIL
jgi:acyl-CoA thioester hydrolase